MSRPQPPDSSREPRPASGVSLALAILQQRTFCPECAAHVDQAVLALLGATIDEIRGMGA